MANYKAPLRDIEFVRNELLGMDSFYAASDQWNEVSNDLASAITEEYAKFSENVLLPINAIGDSQGRLTGIHRCRHHTIRLCDIADLQVSCVFGTLSSSAGCQPQQRCYHHHDFRYTT